MLLLSAAPAFATVVSTAPSAALLGREAVSLLARQAKDPDPEVRAAVAATWGTLGNRAAIPLLRRALEDDKADVRAAAAFSLNRLGEVQGLTALIDETKSVRSGPSANPADELRRMARDAARARATLRLGETGAAAKEALQSALRDASGEVRDAAAIALARLGLRNSEQFLAALKDPDEGIRASAAKALGLIARDGLPELKKLLAADPGVSVRAQAAESIGAFGSDPEGASALIAALKDKSPRVRLSALKALALRDGKDSTAVLKALLAQSPHPEPALIATAALAARGEDADLNLPELTLGQKDPELKALAVEALAASKTPRARDLLVKTMREDTEARVRVQAAAALIDSLRRTETSR